MPVSTRLQLDKVLPIVYEEMRNVASRMMSNERVGHSFQTTELVHEAYVRLAKLEKISWTNRHDIMRIAVGVMRRVLIDYARQHNAKKRDPNQLFLVCPNQGFDDQVEATPNIDLLALDEALNHLWEIDERKAEIVELRYFGGQSVESVSEILSVSTATVKRDWAMAKAWMHRELSDESFQS